MPRAILVVCLVCLGSINVSAQDREAEVWLDPLTRCFHISYGVPGDAPDRVQVFAEWSSPGAAAWHTACIKPLVSETAIALAPEAERQAWRGQGRVIERNAAGLVRTLVFNPYPEAQTDGIVDARFRVRIEALDGTVIARREATLKADNSDVVYLENWAGVFQAELVDTAGTKESGWRFLTGDRANPAASQGNELHGYSGPDSPLPQLSYPLDLRGTHALFVSGASIRLRLSGDERADDVSAGHRDETLWRWAAMDRQHLVMKQGHQFSGWKHAALDYVKLVPLSDELLAKLNSQFDGTPDKFVAGFWEPYTWSFHNLMLEAHDHRDVLTAFREARFSLVDTQINRFGEKAVFETRETDQLVAHTHGDPLENEQIPVTSGVGRMQQYTNALDATIRYVGEMGLHCHANFGSSCCYVGSPLEGQFSKAHPDWIASGTLRYEIPEVRQYALSLVREALEIGAPGITIDFMRYSFCIPDVETCNTFLKELRSLADSFGAKRGKHVPILVQFPGRGVLPPRQFKRGSWDLFDYATWAREGWVDYICPSNDDERHLHLDVTEYLEAVKGTSCTVLPNVTAPGLTKPGLYLWRVKQLYDAGVHGTYVYQSDQLVLGNPGNRRCARLLASSKDVDRWWREDARLRTKRSKGIYITSPSRPRRGWRSRERLRVWLEGLEMREVEIYLNGRLTNHYTKPPYLLGTENRDSDRLIPPARESEVRIRARDGEGWLEETFTIQGTVKQK